MIENQEVFFEEQIAPSDSSVNNTEICIVDEIIFSCTLTAVLHVCIYAYYEKSNKTLFYGVHCCSDFAATIVHHTTAAMVLSWLRLSATPYFNVTAVLLLFCCTFTSTDAASLTERQGNTNSTTPSKIEHPSGIVSCYSQMFCSS